MVVQGHVTRERLLQILTNGESVCIQHIGNAPIQVLDHAVGVRRPWFGQAVFNIQCLAQLIKHMVAGGLTGACQGTCRVHHAAATFLQAADCTAVLMTASRSRSKATASMGFQLRVWRDQRVGLLSRACWYSAWR